MFRNENLKRSRRQSLRLGQRGLGVEKEENISIHKSKELKCIMLKVYRYPNHAAVELNIQ